MLSVISLNVVSSAGHFNQEPLREKIRFLRRIFQNKFQQKIMIHLWKNANTQLKLFFILKHYLKSRKTHILPDWSGNPHWRDRFSAVDLLVLGAFDIATIVYFITKQDTLMRQYIVLSRPRQLVFPGLIFKWNKEREKLRFSTKANYFKLMVCNQN